MRRTKTPSEGPGSSPGGQSALPVVRARKASLRGGVLLLWRLHWVSWPASGQGAFTLVFGSESPLVNSPPLHCKSTS
ncbi:glutaredoxin 5 homolog (S. cerevisiae) (predicted), isoform CRA_a [Rattus norvegicus]|uniref:Glutaredoxin 5 homolog (S. cerevisiae) (Predicted), isoform CRA_a n=1 Tax=Rattus norvegicus TaxID=10116 RepID=A6JES2_RAT|nr:glutaredoxin 5 homolog (S. cerevisiae) (predicted), isoform CRA_a [Rattus norvegicus]